MNEQPRILIVADSLPQSMRLQTDLADKGWEVACAGTADEALERLDTWAPNLLIVDGDLPGLGGEEFCHRVRMNGNTWDIPIIMLTADKDVSIGEWDPNTGADDFFKRSTKPETLMCRVRAMLERSQRAKSVFLQTDAHFQRARILVVNDNKECLADMSKLLEDEGYVVETAGRSREALARLEGEDFDCVLVDMAMPELDGPEMCRRITLMHDRLDNPIAVLTLTGREEEEDITRALEAGADDFLGKSYDKAVLKGRIRALLHRKFYQRESQRILEKLKNRELDAARARAETEAALARAADQRRQQAETTARQMRRAKAKLEQANAQLIQSNEELRQFACLASHDLQEPLRSITSFCNLLKEKCGGKLDQDADDFIRRIVNGAKRMKALVQGLLSYSRVIRIEDDLLQKVDCQSVLEGVLADLKVQIEETGAEISWEEPPMLYGSPSQLTQLLQNLIGNAIRYCDMRPPKVHIGFTVRADECEVSVSDNGVGIAPESQHSIFELFKRLHDRDERSGTGIGLTICKKIVQRHGGTIWVESEPGNGSIFRFTIPDQPLEGNGYEPAEQLCALVGHPAG